MRLAFAMTINKSQGNHQFEVIYEHHHKLLISFSGQTLKAAGLHLEEPCFSHGQLYVGASRVGTKNDLFVLAPNGKTKNVVYKKVLR